MDKKARLVSEACVSEFEKAPTEFFWNWALGSIWHDIGYSFTDGNEQLREEALSSLDRAMWLQSSDLPREQEQVYGLPDHSAIWTQLLYLRSPQELITEAKISPGDLRELLALVKGFSRIAWKPLGPRDFDEKVVTTFSRSPKLEHVMRSADCVTTQHLLSVCGLTGDPADYIFQKVGPSEVACHGALGASLLKRLVSSRETMIGLLSRNEAHERPEVAALMRLPSNLPMVEKALDAIAMHNVRPEKIDSAALSTERLHWKSTPGLVQLLAVCDALQGWDRPCFGNVAAGSDFLRASEVTFEVDSEGTVLWQWGSPIVPLKFEG